MGSGEKVTREQRHQLYRMNLEVLYGRWFSVAEMAQACGIDRKTVYRELRLGFARAYLRDEHAAEEA